MPSAAHGRRKLLRWALLAAAVVAGIALGFVAKHTPAQPVLWAALNLPVGTSVVADNAAGLSPDGQRVLMALAEGYGKPKLWVRSLSSDAAQPLDGTEGAIYPFWSPDSQFMAFSVRRLKPARCSE
jgi:hypothetical protein